MDTVIWWRDGLSISLACVSLHHPSETWVTVSGQPWPSPPLFHVPALFHGQQINITSECVCADILITAEFHQMNSRWAIITLVSKFALSFFCICIFTYFFACIFDFVSDLLILILQIYFLFFILFLILIDWLFMFFFFFERASVLVLTY